MPGATSITFTPSSESNGTWTYEAHFQNVVTNTGSGRYTIEGLGESRPRILIPAGSRRVQTTCGFGSVNQVAPSATLALQPLGCK
jgi:hypothetical protein